MAEPAGRADLITQEPLCPSAIPPRTFLAFSGAMLASPPSVEAQPRPAAADPAHRRPRSPLDTANILSRLSLFWIWPLVRLGFRRPLEEDDLWEVAKFDAPAPAAKVLQENQVRADGSMRWTWSALYRCFGTDAFIAALLYCCSSALRFVGPLILGILVTFVSQTQNASNAGAAAPTLSVGQAYGFAVLLFVSQFLGTFFSVKSDFICMRLGLKARNALIGSTFRKVMSLDNVGRLSTNNGNIITLVSNDSLTALEFTRFFNQAWTAPLILAAGIVYIEVLIGVAVWAGLAILILFIPYTIWQGKVQAKVQQTKMTKTDARVKVTNEALQGIKVVKVNAWEDALFEVMSKARKAELGDLMKLNYLQAVLAPLSISAPNFACVITFIVYVALGNAIQPATAFSVVSLFVIIRQPFIILPMAITQLSRALVMGRRFDKMFNVPSSASLMQGLSGSKSQELFIKNGKFSWTAPEKFNQDKDFCLEVPELQVRPGELLAIVGKVAAGKSSLCSALLCEMTRLQGEQARPLCVAVCLQDAFILNDTVRANILFGTEYDAERYDEAVSCSALKRDLETFPGGDAAEIGERGINLSGGQKARVALARAAFSTAQVVILDDVLAAVDAEVGAYIFEHMLLGAMRNRTRVVVTNNLDLLAKVDRIAVLDHGKVVEVGSRDELLARGDSKLNVLLNQLSSREGVVEAGAKPPLAAQFSMPEIAPPVARPVPLLAQRSIPDVNNNLVTGGAKPTLRAKDEYVSTRKLVETAESRVTVKENRQRGKVANEYYSAYFMAGSLHSRIIVFLLFFSFVVTEANFLAIDSYLAYASQQNSFNVSLFMLTYGLIALSFLVLMFVRSFAFARFHVTAVKEIYGELSASLLRMPMAFYWREPLGRLLNRVSADTTIVDQLLGQSWQWLLMTLARVVGILVIIIYSAPIFAVTIIPLLFIYLIIREFYRRAARELQRIEGVSRSPLYNALSETLSGTTTIRAYGRMEDWLGLADSKLVMNHRAKFAAEAASIWLVMYSEWLGSLVIFLTALVVVGTRNSIGPGFAGLALSFSLNIVVNLNASVRQATLTEQQMTAVERVLQTANEPAEEGLDKGAVDPGPRWPENGKVVFESVGLRYREGLAPALTELSFELKPGERCGICGRTGAGKSSVLVALFRLVDPFQGRVLIDDVDTAQVAKRVLRRRITMVPQDPVLFAGSIRYNLDPFDEHSDDALREAMENAQCLHLCRDQGLDFKISEGGSNLSNGERALFCLARGILRKSSIVLLDEASAALDAHTDMLIQQTIREKFGRATLMVIAHRMDTICDMDSILVMGGGRMVEKDHPALLLRNPDSAFYKLVSETGEESKARLVRMAENALAATSQSV